MRCLHMMRRSRTTGAGSSKHLRPARYCAVQVCLPPTGACTAATPEVAGAQLEGTGAEESTLQDMRRLLEDARCAFQTTSLPPCPCYPPLPPLQCLARLLGRGVTALSRLQCFPYRPAI